MSQPGGGPSTLPLDLRAGRAPDTRLAYVDVLRGMAILTVLVHHLPDRLACAFGELGAWGGRGVDLFFVLSGFLIGSTCLERASLPSHGGALAQAKAYWLLRSARILPLYFGLLTLFALQLPGLNREAGDILLKHPLPFLTFTSNHFGQSTLELGVLWSLAIEEQFYFAVGLLILLCASRREVLSAAFLGLALTAIAGSLAYRHELVGLRDAGVLDERVFTFRLFHSSLSRMDQLALGLVSAVGVSRFNASRLARAGALAQASTWGAVLACFGVLVYFPLLPVIGFAAHGALFAVLILWVQRPAARALAAGRLETVLLLRPLGFVGRLSFGVYLFHPISCTWTDQLLTRAAPALDGAPRAWTFYGSWIAVTLVMAAVSYRFFEEPLLLAARRVSRRLVRGPPTGQRGEAGEPLAHAPPATAPAGTPGLG